MTLNAFHYAASTRVIFVMLMLSAGRGALAESDPSDYQYTSPTAFHQPTVPLPVELGFTQHHSSTAAEGFLRGKAAVIQAKGNFLLAESQAAILFEQGRALNRENDLKQTEALLAQQAMWREARIAEREEREAQRELGRAKLDARRQTVHKVAYQLSPQDLNVLTGEIRWPAALMAEKFAEQRGRMEQLFRQHVSYGDPQPGVAVEISRLSNVMARSLRSEIRTLEKDEYLTAQKFLIGLKIEASGKV
jgi:hypothetical protein